MNCHSKEGFFVYKWMVEELQLKGNELLVFAAAYSNPCEKIEQLTGLSRTTAWRIYNELANKNMFQNETNDMFQNETTETNMFQNETILDNNIYNNNIYNNNIYNNKKKIFFDKIMGLKNTLPFEFKKKFVEIFTTVNKETGLMKYEEYKNFNEEQTLLRCWRKYNSSKNSTTKQYIQTDNPLHKLF